MCKVDYIIVGNGFAAMFLAHQFIKANRSFLIFSKEKKGASHVSAGIINPVVLKKFTTFSKAKEQIDDLQLTINEIENYSKNKISSIETIVRIFHDETEKNLWLKKSNNEELKPFLDQEFLKTNTIKNNFGMGRVKHSFRLCVGVFFNEMFSYLEENKYLVHDWFDFEKLNLKAKNYHEINFNKIIFCEGISVLQNPFFSNLPIQVNKGHHLLVKLSKPLEQEFIYKKKHFLFPFQDDLYYYGGTYERDNFTHQIDETEVLQLKKGLEEIYPYPYHIEDIRYGFRPTTKDRRPIIGNHKLYAELYVFNGLGTRGILNGNYYAKKLFRHLEYQEPIPEEVSITRS